MTHYFVDYNFYFHSCWVYGYIQYLWSKLDNWKTWKTRCTEIVDTGQLFVLEN